MSNLKFFQICVGQYTADDSPAVQQLPMYAANHNHNTTFAQNDFGIVYPSLTASLIIQPTNQCKNKYQSQHILLQDRFLLEFLQSVNRERIPERIVHAKGAGKSIYNILTISKSRLTIERNLVKACAPFALFSTICSFNINQKAQIEGKALFRHKK